MHSNFIFIFGMCRLFVSTLLNVYHVARDCDNYLGKNIICWMANMYTVICWFVCVCVHYRCHFFFYLFMNTLHSAYWILNAKWWQFSFVFDLILFFFSFFSYFYFISYILPVIPMHMLAVSESSEYGITYHSGLFYANRIYSVSLCLYIISMQSYATSKVLIGPICIQHKYTYYVMSVINEFLVHIAV